MSRLDGFIRRMEAQIACLDFACEEIHNVKGLVYEFGLGNGRTYEHLRLRMPSRSILVFERDVDAIKQYTDGFGQGIFVCVGNVETIFSNIGNQEILLAPVALIHSDLGDWNVTENIERANSIFNALVPKLQEGAYIVCSVPLTHKNLFQMGLPAGIRHDKYFIYRIQFVDQGRD
jgi:hypothetical protein